MPMSSALLGEFDHEMKTTRSILERVPEKDLAWKPHAKSYSLGELAAHVAGLLNWIPRAFVGTEFDMKSIPRANPIASTKELLERFDESSRKAREIIERASDDELNTKWQLRNGERVMFTMPRKVSLRSFVMNHHIHHRGQLSVYLRLLDVPLPEMYGPTADTRR